VRRWVGNGLHAATWGHQRKSSTPERAYRDLRSSILAKKEEDVNGGPVRGYVYTPGSNLSLLAGRGSGTQRCGGSVGFLVLRKKEGEAQRGHSTWAISLYL